MTTDYRDLPTAKLIEMRDAALKIQTGHPPLDECEALDAAILAALNAEIKRRTN